jgi:hypothetical protein
MRRLAAWIAVVLLAAGCGGTHHRPTPSPSPAPRASAPPAPAGKSAYVAAMRRYGAAAAAATALLDRRPSHAQLLHALRAVRAARWGMQHLRPPAEVRQAHRDYTAAFTFSTRRLTAALRAELAGDGQRARRIEREDLPESVRSRFNRALIAFGEKRYAIHA